MGSGKMGSGLTNGDFSNVWRRGLWRRGQAWQMGVSPISSWFSLTLSSHIWVSTNNETTEQQQNNRVRLTRWQDPSESEHLESLTPLAWFLLFGNLGSGLTNGCFVYLILIFFNYFKPHMSLIQGDSIPNSADLAKKSQKRIFLENHHRYFNKLFQF